MVTTVSIRLALRKILTAACGVESEHISVLIPSSVTPRVFIASIPIHHRAAAYQYLADHVELTVPVGRDPLVLTLHEAQELLNHAMALPAAAAVA